MKKFLALTLSLAMALSLAAVGAFVLIAGATLVVLRRRKS